MLAVGIRDWPPMGDSAMGESTGAVISGERDSRRAERGGFEGEAEVSGTVKSGENEDARAARGETEGETESHRFAKVRERTTGSEGAKAGAPSVSEPFGAPQPS